MSEEAKEQMAAYVPPEVTNLYMTGEDFVGTITNSYYAGEGLKSEPDELCLFNPMGENILPEIQNQTFDKEAVLLNFVDLCIDDDGFMTLIDNQRCKIYQFDPHMNLIAAFGASGQYEGAFSAPVAIAAFEEYLYVLDAANCSLTILRLTDYGEKIHKALIIYSTERHDQAIEPWQDVLRMNANYDLAYIGIGNVLLNQGQYQEAMTYFRLGHDSSRYNEAFKQFRIQFLRSHTFELFAAAVALIALWRCGVYAYRRVRARRRG